MHSISYILNLIKQENENQENTTLSEHFQNPIKKSHIETQIDTPYPHIHDCSLSLLGIGTSIIRGGDKLVIWIQTIPPSETVQPRMCLQHASKMPTPAYNRANSAVIKNNLEHHTQHI
jgi:hypothetical protein